MRTQLWLHHNLESFKAIWNVLVAKERSRMSIKSPMDLTPERQYLKDSIVKRPVRILVLAIIPNVEVEPTVSR
jgi:hypothetical protein